MASYRYLVAALICFGLSGACWLVYEWMGATVDEDGWLVEEFALILPGLALPAVGASCRWLPPLG